MIFMSELVNFPTLSKLNFKYKWTVFLGSFFLTFIGLKLAGLITWSWIWVLSPVWLPVVSFTALLVGIILSGRRAD